ncbi:ankyrin repeat domain-containing protein 49-like [Clytia hemisphaerica]|uniref:ankyrin repeat domain-containing protein 49-like n=1 Tax=Clytia hemisphaerica TaxID=252671 RepID=UPI0034D453B4
MSEEYGILKVDKDLDKDEHMLPVHFLPEGKKAYDWINEDLKKDETTNHSLQYQILNREEDKPPDTCKGKASTVNSVVYHQAHISSDLSSSSPINERQLVHSLLSGAERGDIDTVTSILKDHPLIINKTDSDGYTALHRACYSGHDEMVLLLIQRGGNVHSSTDDGWQPLHCAVRWNNVTICKHLISKKADINATTNGKQTPLHFAALTIDNKDILEMLLLQPEIDLNIRNAAGDTAYDIAHRSGAQFQLFELKDNGLKI